MLLTLSVLGWLRFKESDYLLTLVDNENDAIGKWAVACFLMTVAKMSKVLTFVSDGKLEAKVIKEFKKFIKKQWEIVCKI